MKKYFSLMYIILLMLLFVYTSSSKFLDYEKFVFQMRLAPVPLMTILAPTLGWLVPCIEMTIAMALAIGFFYPIIQHKAVYWSVILLSAFEIYIAIMLLSASHLPCTCGGIISTMGWKQHLLFNGFFIITGILLIKYRLRQQSKVLDKNSNNEYKILSRA